MLLHEAGLEKGLLHSTTLPAARLKYKVRDPCIRTAVLQAFSDVLSDVEPSFDRRQTNEPFLNKVLCPADTMLNWTLYTTTKKLKMGSF